MNWLAQIKSYLVLLGIITLGTACDTAGEIGSSLIPRGAVEVIASDTFNISSSTVLLDSIVTVSTPAFLVGVYDDPIFGRVKASSFFEFGPGLDDLLTDVENNLGIPDSSVFDSVRITLQLVSAYGATDQVQTFGIFQLTDSLDSDIDYTNRDEIPFDPVPITTITTSAEELAETPFLQRTLIPETSAWARKFDELIFSGTRPNTDEFREAFNGLALIPIEDSPGSIIRFNAALVGTSPPLVVRIFFTDNEGVSASTALTFLRTGFPRFNKIESERQGTVLENLQTPFQEISSTQTNQQTFVQSGVGIFTRLSIPGIESLISPSGSPIGVNEATLIIKPNFGSVDDFFPPPELVLYQTDDNNRVLEVEVIEDLNAPITGTAFPFVFVYDPRFEEYRADVTTYLQNVLNGTEDGNALLLGAPNNGIDFLLNNSRLAPSQNGISSSINRTVLNMDNSNSVVSSRLEITYTRFE